MHSTEELQKKSTLVLEDRQALTLSGVCDVISFDEGVLVLETTLGVLTVDGAGLHILSLDLDGGRVSVTGKVSGIFYTDKGAGNKGGFFSRMVK